jgi:hypothetical protein
MLSKFPKCEKLMFVRENFLVSCTEIAHDLAMLRLDMSMEIWPAEARYITVPIRAIVPEQKYGILKDDFLLVFDT